MSEEQNVNKWEADLKTAASFSPHKHNKINPKNNTITIDKAVEMLDNNDKRIKRLEKQVDNLITLIKLNKNNNNLIRNLRNRINQLESDNDGSNRR